jgi:hypothetical protein
MATAWLSPAALGLFFLNNAPGSFAGGLEACLESPSTKLPWSSAVNFIRNLSSPWRCPMTDDSRKSNVPLHLRRSALATLLALMVTGGRVHADSIIANNFPSPPSYSSFDLGIGFAGNTSNGPFTNETPAQEFTAQMSGVISQIVASVGQFQPEGVPLTVTVLEAAGSIPGTALGSLTFATNQVSSNAFNSPSTFDFSSANISLTSGQNYFVEFSVATPINGSIRYQALLLTTPSPIAFGFPAIDSPDGGVTWLAPVIPNEIGLTIFGSVVPEPGSCVLLALGLGSAGAGATFVRKYRSTRSS